MTDKNEPLAWTPRLLAFQEAVDLHDLRHVLEDFRFANTCFEAIQSREYGVVFSMWSGAEDPNFVDWCKFVAGSISYRRCFKSGVRSRISRDDVCKILDDSEVRLHDTLIAIVDKHVAHSVNEMDVGCTNIYVAIDSKGRLHRGGLGSNRNTAGPLGPPAYAAIRGMISKIIAEVIDIRIPALEQLVQAKVDRMSDQAILELPVGFAPHIEDIRHDKPRNWPGRSG